MKSLIFLHIPKCAGFMLKQLLQRSVGFGNSVIDVHMFPDKDQFLATQTGLKLIEGHIPHGLHEHLQYPCQYITVFRDPVARVVSLLKHISRHQDHPLHQRLMKEGPESCLSTDISRQYINAQTRFIAGGSYFLEGASTEEMLQVAIQNLKQDLFFGFMEQLEEFLYLLCLEAGINFDHLDVVNAAPPMQNEFVVTDRLVELILEQVQLDLRLIDVAKDLYRQRKAEVMQRFDSISAKEGAFLYDFSVNDTPHQQAIIKVEDGWVAIRGWAFEKQEHQPPDAVLVQLNDEEPTLATTGLERVDISRMYKKLSLGRSGFFTKLKVDKSSGPQSVTITFISARRRIKQRVSLIFTLAKRDHDAGRGEGKGFFAGRSSWSGLN